MNGTWTDILGATKARPKKTVPNYLGADAEGVSAYQNILSIDFNEQDYRKIATKISWVYSNVIRISREVSAAPVWLYDSETDTKIKKHPFYELRDAPNPFFSFTTLLEYVIWSLMLNESGAYLFLAPDRKNVNKINEIWPVMADQVIPIKDENRFISHYEYRPKSATSNRPVIIPTKYMVRFFFPHPYDYWKSLTPLQASQFSIDIYTAITSSQSTLFTEGGGVPLSLVTLDKNISNTDFEITKEQIREDWEAKRRIAVARSGTIDVKNIGISNKDLEVIASQNINRDEIDSTFALIPWRSDAMTTGDGMREANKQIKEFVINPIHKLLAAQFKIHLLNQFYGDENIYLQFDDVRQQDKALLIQQWNVEWRVKTLNEARTDLGLSPYDAELFSMIGELPVSLANNAQFVMALINMSREQAMIESGQIEDPADIEDFTGIGDIADDKQPPITTGVGNLPGSMAPSRTSDMVASGDKGVEINNLFDVPVDIQEVKDIIENARNKTDLYGGAVEHSFTPAEKMGILTELKNYEKIVRRVVERTGKAADTVEFVTEIIPKSIMSKLLESLKSVKDPDEVKMIFDTIRDKELKD